MDTTTLKRVVPLLVLFKRMAVAVEFMRGVAGANQDTDGKKRRSSMVISILAPKPRKVLPLLVRDPVSSYNRQRVLANGTLNTFLFSST